MSKYQIYSENMHETQLPIYEKFDVNYYRWSLGEAERELNEDFKLLKKVKGTAAIAYIAYLDSLSADDKRTLASALVKRANPAAVKTLGESYTEQDAEAVEVFRGYLMKAFRTSSNRVEYHSNGVPKSRVDRKLLSNLIGKVLIPICGTIQQPRRRSEWAHRLEYEHYAVITTVAINNAVEQIRYTHTIIPNNKNLNYETRLIDLMRWLGIHETQWNLLNLGDEEGAAQSVAELCSHFMQALPIILAKS